MVAEAEQLRKTYLESGGSFLFELEESVKSSLVVSCHEHCALHVLAAEELEVPQIIDSGSLEAVNNRIRLLVFLDDLTFLNEISPSH